MREKGGGGGGGMQIVFSSSLGDTPVHVTQQMQTSLAFGLVPTASCIRFALLVGIVAEHGEYEIENSLIFF